MVSRILVFALALGLTACSQDRAAQTPAQPATAPPPAATPQPAAAPAQPQNAAPAEAPPSPESKRAAPSRPAPNASAPASAAPAAAATPARAAAAPPAPAAPPEPQFQDVEIPAGTPIAVKLSTPLASDTSKLEDQVRGTLTSPIVIGGVTAVPAGTDVVGTVHSVARSGRVKGRASIAFKFDRLIVHKESHALQTAMITREAEANKSEDVKKGAIGGAAGAVVGGILGGGKGAAIGAGVGGAGAVAATRGDEVRLPVGTTVRTTLQAPLTVTVPR